MRCDVPDGDQIIEIADQDITVGLVDNDSGCVGVTVHYTAILLRPFPLEVMDAVVTNAVEVRPGHLLLYSACALCRLAGQSLLCWFTL